MISMRGLFSILCRGACVVFSTSVPIFFLCFLFHPPLLVSLGPSSSLKEIVELAIIKSGVFPITTLLCVLECRWFV